MTILAIDAGTTGVTALIVTADGQIAARGYQEFAQHFPQPGWVEHAPEEIWQATLAAGRTAIDAHSGDAPTAIGITNQRETAVLWDRETLAAPRRAVVWQDRRTAEICDRLKSAGHEARVAELTGLRLDPYFTGTKLTWLAEHDPDAWSGVMAGRVAVGTVDSYLIARLTAGRVHATDPSNASRTLLFDIHAGGWSDELCGLLNVPRAALPEVRRSSGDFGRSDSDAFLGLDLPIAGVAGDQQAALFGQACFGDGESKCTYGTGSFILVNTGETAVRSDAGLLTTVAWDIGDGPVYALEGAIFVTGAAVQWLRDGLGIISNASETEAVARTVSDSDGVVFVPALTGLGAPHWDPQARGTITGITRGTTRAHLVRATLEAISFEVRDVVDVMTRDAGINLPELSVDGGAAANDLLCQLQATQLQVPVRRPLVAETTALGAAFLAGLASGVWSSTDELRDTWRLDRRFEPAERDDAGYDRWLDAVRRTRTPASEDKPPIRLQGQLGGDCRIEPDG
ncbi:MAG TPA: glycerol kinase GlpK [Mycobacteriales bacterium]|nr:glycerol kinase GlpK [Mycobacteriales bacterium]